MYFAPSTIVSSKTIILALLALLPSLATSTITTAPPLTSGSVTCKTITSTNGGSCPTPSPCIMAACLLLSTVTLNCGCPSIYTTRVCASTCPPGCGTSYSTLYLPCASSFSGYSTWISTTSVLRNKSTETGSVTTGSATSPCPTASASMSGNTTYSTEYNSTETITCTQTIPINTTTLIVTSTQISTLTSCPPKITCNGQTSSWTGTGGPYTCVAGKTCSCVLPGGGNATITGTGEVGSSSGPVVATTSGKGSSGATTRGAATSSASLVQANGAGRVGGVFEGWVLGILGLALGGL